LGIVVAAASPANGVGVLVTLGLLAVFLEVVNERTRVEVRPEGLRVVPMFGRSTTYPWSEIQGFSVGRVPGARFGGPCVSMSLSARGVFLGPALRRSDRHGELQRVCDRLNAELGRDRDGLRS